VRVEVAAQAHRDPAAGGLPRPAGQQPGPWVGPAPAGRGVDVAASQGLAEALQDQEGVGGTVQQTVRPRTRAAQGPVALQTA
jgi:hypothetical protein